MQYFHRIYWVYIWTVLLAIPAFSMDKPEEAQGPAETSEPSVKPSPSLSAPSLHEEAPLVVKDHSGPGVVPGSGC